MVCRCREIEAEIAILWYGGEFSGFMLPVSGAAATSATIQKSRLADLAIELSLEVAANTSDASRSRNYILGILASSKPRCTRSQGVLSISFALEPLNVTLIIFAEP